MDTESPGRARQVIGPEGVPLTIDDLPSPDTVRWVIRRKAEIIAAINGGLLTMEEACERYCLSVDELLSWQRLIDDHGVRGLRVTRLKKYRKSRRKGAQASDSRVNGYESQ